VTARPETEAELGRRTAQQAAMIELGGRAIEGVDAETLIGEAVDAVVRVLGVESAAVVRSGGGAAGASAAGGMSTIVKEGSARVGTLTVHASSTRTFEPDERDFLQAVANVIGAAVAGEHKQQLCAQVERRLTRLQVIAGEAAHDLKNLLGVVISCGEFAIDAARDQPELRSDLEEIMGAAERAAAVAASLELDAVEVVRLDAVIASGTTGVRGLGETILVVEDEDAVRRLATRLLSESGYDILAAASFDAAASLWEEHRASIDLLLTDVELGERSGVDLADVVWRTAPDLPVLFLSGDAAGETLEGVGERRTAVVAKPLGSDSLLSSVGAVLDGRA
jgi:CheY-like chemotaxis protein